MLEAARVRIEESDIEERGLVERVFDFLDNNGGLTEEFLYQHQPVTIDPIPVYATNIQPIGRLDRAVAVQYNLAILCGPAIVVARKGYAGRLFVVRDQEFIVQEDAYAIVPKSAYIKNLNLDWFAAHYSEEFQGLRTSDDGIGDFPRVLLRSRSIIIPKLNVQERLADLYRRRDELMIAINSAGERIQDRILSHVQ